MERKRDKETGDDEGSQKESTEGPTLFPILFVIPYLFSSLSSPDSLPLISVGQEDEYSHPSSIPIFFSCVKMQSSVKSILLRLYSDPDQASRDSADSFLRGICTTSSSTSFLPSQSFSLCVFSFCIIICLSISL